MKHKTLFLILLTLCLTILGAQALSGSFEVGAPAQVGASVSAKKSAGTDISSVSVSSSAETDISSVSVNSSAETDVSSVSASRSAETESDPAAADTSVGLRTIASSAQARAGGFLEIGPYRVRAVDVLDISPDVPVGSSLVSETDLRVYRLTVDKRGVLQPRFSYNFSEVSGTPWMLSLYEAYASDGEGEPDAFRLLSTTAVSANQTETLGEKTGVYPGIYYLIVAPGDALSVDEFTAAVSFFDTEPWEAEPNDSVTRYTELSPDIRMGGASSAKTGGDKDFFLLTVPARGIVTLTFEHSDEKLPQVGWIATLRNAAGETVWKKLSYYSDTSLDSGEIGLEAGAYFLSIESHIQNGADYFVTWHFEALDTYETEGNDTRETADAIVVNAPDGGVSGSLSDRTETPDRDWYRFELDADGVISFSFVHRDYLRNRDGWTIAVTDEAGQVLYKMVSRWSDMAISSPQLGLGRGVYYILVDGENMLLNSGTYIVALTFAEGENWESEPNDTVETADTLSVNEDIFGALIGTETNYDTDCYQFELTRTAPVSFRLSHAGYAQDFEGWRVSLRNEDGRTLSSFTSKWSDTQTDSPLLNLSPGRYFIVVETGARFSDIRYSLHVTTN